MKIRAFSIIELTVTLSIISILSLIIFANYRLGEKKYILQSETQKLISNLRRGQNMALAPKVLPNYESGIGLRFDKNNPNSYIFFRDAEPGNKIFNRGDKIEETVNFPVGISINSLSPANSVDIFFEPPDPTIYINGNSISASSVIGLEYKSGNTVFDKNITIKTTGLIQ